MFEFFISKRYLKSKHKINFISIISILSTLGITIGVAALIIVISVFNGFGSLVTKILVSFDPQIKIVALSDTGITQLDSVKTFTQSLAQVQSINSYVEGKSVLISDNRYEIINVKGIDFKSSNFKEEIKSKIVSGEFDLDSSDVSKIILGSQLALKLSRFVGDTLDATSFAGLESTLINYTIPETEEFVVTGIFSSNNKNYDSNIAFTSLHAAQTLLKMDNRISGLEIRLHNINNSIPVKKELLEFLNSNNFSVYTWYDLHKDLYDVMLIERWSAFIILSLIILVATFNILGSLTMTVIEKRKDIGILRTLGATNNSIKRIFMFNGLLVGLIGTLSGLAIGLAVCYAQIHFNFYSLDPRKYIIDALPVQLNLSDILLIAGVSYLLSYVASLYPAKKATDISIADSIKWE